MAPAKSCANCGHTDFVRDDQASELVCRDCGTVAEENTIVSEISFSEGPAGKSMVSGQYVSQNQTGAMNTGLHGVQHCDSRRQTIERARQRMEKIGSRLGIPEHTVESALRHFRFALNKNFVKGRKSQYVLSACLYLACREAKSDQMLMDFSELIHVNVFNIGTTYLQLVRTLEIKSLPIVDPTIYLHRFVAKLEFGPQGSRLVLGDAKLLVHRMGKDWLQQGRRPAGVAAACILLAARMNNYRRSKAEIVQVAKVAEDTLQRRLDEFKSTSAGSLSVDDFRHTNVESAADPPSFTRHRELERRLIEKQAADEEARERGEFPEDTYLDEELVSLARDLDKDDGTIIELTKDVDATLESKELEGALSSMPSVKTRPQANQSLRSELGRAPGPRLRTYNDESETGDYDDDEVDDDDEEYGRDAGIFVDASVADSPLAQAEAEMEMSGVASAVATALANSPSSVERIDSTSSLGRAEKYLAEFRRRRSERLEEERRAQRRITTSQQEAEPTEESLSDLDDDEIESILLTEEEIELKSRVWTSINREFLLEQERKRLMLESDQRLGLSRPTKKRKKTKPRVDGLREDAESAGSSTIKMLKEKTHTKKINFNVLNNLFTASSSSAPVGTNRK